MWHGMHIMAVLVLCGFSVCNKINGFLLEGMRFSPPILETSTTLETSTLPFQLSLFVENVSPAPASKDSRDHITGPLTLNPSLEDFTDHIVGPLTLNPLEDFRPHYRTPDLKP